MTRERQLTARKMKRRKRTNNKLGEEPNLGSSLFFEFFGHLLEEANLTQKDICEIFREYENERVWCPICSCRSMEQKEYDARIWTLHTMKALMLDKFNEGGPEIMLFHADRFAKFLDKCCMDHPMGSEFNRLFSVCYDTAMDIITHFLV